MPEGWSRRVFRTRTGKVRRARVLAVVCGLTAAVAAAAAPLYATSPVNRMPTGTVCRASFDSLVLAAGRVESATQTEIRCTLEKVGTAMAPTILTIVEDGTNVKKGQLLCEIDASDYAELVRRQTIAVDQARAAYDQAKLDLEVAGIGRAAYIEGEMLQTDRLYRGQIALARSDLVRQEDRVGWSKRMHTKGYYATAQVTTEELTLRRAVLSLAQTQRAFQIFQRFSAPMMQRALDSQINGAKASLDFQTIKLRREEERLKLYQAMVDRCSVRAPHDGFLIHANQPGRTPEVYEGATVRERMRLFTLPDLSRMNVEVLLHETVVSNVKIGMPVKVRIEALPGRLFEGTVSSVAPLPYNERKRDSDKADVTYFLGKVQLDSETEGLRPGMTAELEIRTARREGVLAVPSQAVFDVGDRQVCYVVRGEGGRLEQRAVTLGYSSHDLKEVVSGLTAGEEVALAAPPGHEAAPHVPAASAAKSWDFAGKAVPQVGKAKAEGRASGAQGKGPRTKGRGGARGKGKGARGATDGETP